MVVGDSISQGLEGDYTWRYRLKERLAATATDVDFVGPWSGTTRIPSHYSTSSQPAVHDGAYRPGISFTDSQNLAQWGWQMAQAKWDIASNVATYQPDYLLVELGFNDLGWFVSGPQGTADSLREFITNARAAKPDVRILVANVVHRSPLGDSNPDLPQKITDYNGLLPALVSSVSTSQSPVALVDLDGAYDYTTDSYDDLHPNVRGEYVIARAFANALANRFSLGAAWADLPGSMPADLHPSPPTAVQVVRSGDGLQISWTHSFGAGGYRLFTRDVTKGDGFQPSYYAIGADDWTSANLPAGHVFEYYVKPERGNYTGGASPTAQGTVTPLPKVQNVTTSNDKDQPYTATVHWSPVDGAADYHVYAAPCKGLEGGCSPAWEPPASDYKLVQWNLSGKTSWTQGYVLDCTWYYVVAEKNGGEGPASAPSFECPYVGNYYNLLARNRYLDTAPDAGDYKLVTKVAANANGLDEMVVGRGFIGTKPGGSIFDSLGHWTAATLTNAISDGRTFSDNPYGSSKVGVGWNPRTGEVGIYVHRSCAIIYFDQTCKDAYPVKLVPDASIYGDSNIDSYNYVSVAKDGADLVVTVAALNSWNRIVGILPAGLRADFNGTGESFGRINAKFRIHPSGSSYSVSLVADKFPSWEFYRYPKTTEVIAGVQLVPSITLGKRDQTDITALRAGSPSTCTSSGGEWMSCS